MWLGVETPENHADRFVSAVEHNFENKHSDIQLMCKLGTAEDFSWDNFNIIRNREEYSENKNNETNKIDLHRYDSENRIAACIER